MNIVIPNFTKHIWYFLTYKYFQAQRMDNAMKPFSLMYVFTNIQQRFSK